MARFSRNEKPLSRHFCLRSRSRKNKCLECFKDYSNFKRRIHVTDSLSTLPLSISLRASGLKSTTARPTQANQFLQINLCRQRSVSKIQQKLNLKQLPSSNPTNSFRTEYNSSKSPVFKAFELVYHMRLFLTSRRIKSSSFGSTSMCFK